MKKIIAVIILAVHLFNLAGYSLFFQYFINRNDKNLLIQLDSNKFDESKLIEIKIPVRLPYVTDREEYERIDGQMEVNGTYYTYVKRKILRDTIYLMCLPNPGKTQINNARANFSKEISDDVTSNKKNSPPKVKKECFSKEYNCQQRKFNFSLPIAVLDNSFQQISSHPLNSFLEVTIQPPDFIS